MRFIRTVKGYKKFERIRSDNIIFRVQSTTEVERWMNQVTRVRRDIKPRRKISVYSMIQYRTAVLQELIHTIKVSKIVPTEGACFFFVSPPFCGCDQKCISQ